MITYKEAGVNIEEGYKSVKLIKEYASKNNESICFKWSWKFCWDG